MTSSARLSEPDMKAQAEFTFAQLDDYTIFMPPPRPPQKGPTRNQQMVALNSEFLRQHPQPLPEKAITGSFIYAHPPNYKGCCTLHFTEDDWLRELKRLQDLGIDTVIFQASLWNELQECYYLSDTFKNYKTWNVVEPMLHAASRLNLTVFLGGYGSVTCWMDKLNSNVVNQEKARQMACFQELLRYGDLFQGFYFSPESAYTGCRDARRESFLRELYGGLFTAVKEQRPELKIMMSPATFYHPGKMDEMADAWCSLLDGVPLDILAPQDSVGCACIDLAHQDEAFRQWKKIADARSLQLWSNVEIFSVRLPGCTPVCREAAPPERVIAQMNHAAPYVSKLITWEAPYYTRSEAGPNGDRIRREIFHVN